jgi:hypothetical protein
VRKKESELRLSFVDSQFDGRHDFVVGKIIRNCILFFFNINHSCILHSCVNSNVEFLIFSHFQSHFDATTKFKKKKNFKNFEQFAESVCLASPPCTRPLCFSHTVIAFTMDSPRMASVAAQLEQLTLGSASPAVLAERSINVDNTAPAALSKPPSFRRERTTLSFCPPTGR